VIPRYTPPAIAAVFNEQAKLDRWLEIELLAAEGWARTGRVSAVEARALRASFDGRHVDPARAAELEAEQGHDVAAFVSAAQEMVGDEARLIHLGLTSSDIVDTCLAWQLRDAGEVVDRDGAALQETVAELAVRHRTTLMAGRTHGVHAEPMTLGFKLANHYDELQRSCARLSAALAEVAVGKISGPVGSHTTVSPLVEEYVCERLGLGVARVTTQVLARDRHASLLTSMAILGGVLERLATSVRLLQQTEVGEAEEPFASRQKGSSAMPHKRNPVLAERVVGMARVLRGYAAVALEDVALWHERDISHSSAERIVLPDAFALLDYMLQLCTRLMRGLRVDAERMRANLDWGGGLTFSPRVLGALLLEARWPRERAYRAVQRLAFAARDGQGSFRDLVTADTEVGGALREAGIAVEDCFDPSAFTHHIDDTYRRLGLPLWDAERDTPEPVGAPAMAADTGLGGGSL
jgi:adenylosuccinate lyase